MLLENKNGIIFGVANKRSIAWATAQACMEAGARLAFTYQNERLRENVEELDRGDGRAARPVRRDEPGGGRGGLRRRRARSSAGSTFSSTASPSRRARRSKASTSTTTREAFLTALDISAYSLAELARAAAPLMTEGGSIVSMTYYGAEKVVANYNVMGVAKAALEASTRYLAADLGKQQHPRQHHQRRPHQHARRARRRQPERDAQATTPSARPCAATSRRARSATPRSSSCSPLSSGITGEVLHVDCGYNIMAF